MKLIATTVLLAGILLGCNRDAEGQGQPDPAPAAAPQGPSTGEPRFEASCVVNLWSSAPSATFVHGMGEAAPTPEAASASAWAALCPQLELPGGCGDAPPEDLQISESCSQVTGNDQTSHSCVMTATVRHERQRTTITLERAGSEAETDTDALCAEALAQACAEVGAEPGCTEGDAPAWAFSAVPSREPVP